MSETENEALIRKIIERHIIQFNNSDIDGLAIDYADDAVLILDNKVYQGKREVLKFFERFFSSAENLLKTTPAEFRMHVGMVTGNVGSLVWIIHRDTPHVMTAEDVFVFRDGKIVFQTPINIGPYTGE